MPTDPSSSTALRRVHQQVWKRLGNPKNCVEAFLNAPPVLLARPAPHAPWARHETLNDPCGQIANFQRSINTDPHRVQRVWRSPGSRPAATDLLERLLNDPFYCDPASAGRWARQVTDTLYPAYLADPASASQACQALLNRLRRVRVVSGSWERVLRNAATPPAGHHTGVILRPGPDHPDRALIRRWALTCTFSRTLRVAYWPDRHESLTAFRAQGWHLHRPRTTGSASGPVLFNPLCDPD